MGKSMLTRGSSIQTLAEHAYPLDCELLFDVGYVVLLLFMLRGPLEQMVGSADILKRLRFWRSGIR